MTDRVDIKEVSQGQFTAWKQHPMTGLFQQYLKDYAERLVTEAMERWRGGNQKPEVELFARGVVNALEEIAQAEFAAMTAFYGIQKPEEEDSQNGKPPTE